MPKAEPTCSPTGDADAEPPSSPRAKGPDRGELPDNGEFDVTLFRKSGDIWAPLGKVRSKASGNAYFKDYVIQGGEQLFAQRSNGETTGSETADATYDRPGELPPRPARSARPGQGAGRPYRHGGGQLPQRHPPGHPVPERRVEVEGHRPRAPATPPATPLHRNQVRRPAEDLRGHEHRHPHDGQGRSRRGTAQQHHGRPEDPRQQRRLRDHRQRRRRRSQGRRLRGQGRPGDRRVPTETFDVETIAVRGNSSATSRRSRTS